MSFRFRQSYVLLGTVVLLLAGVLGQGHSGTCESASARVTLTFWHQETPPERVRTFQWVIDQFMKENPGILVQQESLGWDVFHPRMLSAIKVGNPPDMCWTSPDLLTTIYRTGALKPVDDIVDAIDKEYGYIKQQTKPYYWQGHFWAVPTMSIVHTLMYREDLLKEAGFTSPPATWSELLKVAEALTKGGRYGIGIPLANNFFTDQVLYNFMATIGAAVFDAKGNIVFGSERTVEALEFYRSLSKFSPPDSTVWTWAESDQALATERCAMVINLGCSLAPFVAQHPDKVKYLKAAGIPVPDKGGKPGCTSFTLGVMVFTSDPLKHDAIRRFLLFMMRPDIGGHLAANMHPGLFLPITEKGRVSESFWGHPVVSQLRGPIETEIEQLKYGSLYGFASGEPHLKIGDVIGANLLGQTVQQMVVKGLSPQEAAKWGAERIKEIVEKP